MSMDTYPVVGWGLPYQDLLTFLKAEVEQDEVDDYIDNNNGLPPFSFAMGCGEDQDEDFIILYAGYPWEGWKYDNQTGYIRAVYDLCKKQGWLADGSTFKDFKKLNWGEISTTFWG